MKYCSSPDSSVTPLSKWAADTTHVFRDEILESRGSHRLGNIRVIQPLATSLIALVASLIVISVILFVLLGTFAKKAHVAGVTTPSLGSLSITAPTAGVIVRRMVEEGQQVNQGQPLFELSTERQGKNGEISALVAHQIGIRQQTIEAERRSRMSHDVDRRRSLNGRLATLAMERGHLDGEVTLATRRRDLARAKLTKYEMLQTNGFVSAIQTQAIQEELIDLATRLSALYRSRVHLEANRHALEAESNDLSRNLATELAQLDRAASMLAQESAENQSRKATLIVAPRDGIVATLTYQTGQAVVGGQVLARLLSTSAKKPLDELEVHLYAASRTAGFVAPGQRVLIRYHAFPYQKFGLQDGTVTDVSKTPFAPNELPDHLASTILSNSQKTGSGFSPNEALYRIRVKLRRQTIDMYGSPQQLKPGMTLEADVLQDRRKVWEWIAEPLLSVARR